MSADRLHSYKLLAELCDYPTSRTAATARLTAMFLEERCPEAASAIKRFVARVDGPPLAELEERYSAVFDFHPARTLDLGYQLFGETYKRGVFLVRMKEAALAHAIDTAAELPDHLPNVLRLDAGQAYRFKMMAVDIAHGASIQLGQRGRMMRLQAGRITETALTFQKPGRYLMVCTVYCGEAHQLMQATIEVV